VGLSNGSRWVSHLLTHGGGSVSPSETEYEYEYSGGVALDHQDPSNPYLARQVPGGWQIERWSTHDGGAHWARQPVAAAGETDNVRPVVARGPTTELFWLHGVYNTCTTYRTSVQVSPSAPRRSPRHRDPGAGRVTRRAALVRPLDGCDGRRGNSFALVRFCIRLTASVEALSMASSSPQLRPRISPLVAIFSPRWRPRISPPTD
jgi:hypothetical protein